jgi:hypothetical protein
MYGTELVIPAIKRALKKRGFKYPGKGAGIGKDVVFARRAAFCAFRNFTTATSSGIATMMQCSPATTANIAASENKWFKSKQERDNWLEDVLNEILDEQNHRRVRQ